MNDHEAKALDCLTRAVAEALERKRRLGQYYVVWRDGRAVCIGPDAPATLADTPLESFRGPDMPATAAVHSDQDILGGTPVFVGTRVPFRNLIDYLERNHSLDEFLDSFPTVSREQAVAALEAAHEALITRARAAG
jgi:uncharacterized protein (DUF433 family)